MPIIWSIVLLVNEASLTPLSLPDIYLIIFQSWLLHLHGNPNCNWNKWDNKGIHRGLTVCKPTVFAGYICLEFLRYIHCSGDFYYLSPIFLCLLLIARFRTTLFFLFCFLIRTINFIGLSKGGIEDVNSRVFFLGWNRKFFVCDFGTV